MKPPEIVNFPTLSETRFDNERNNVWDIVYAYPFAQFASPKDLDSLVDRVMTEYAHIFEEGVLSAHANPSLAFVNPYVKPVTTVKEHPAHVQP